MKISKKSDQQKSKNSNGNCFNCCDFGNMPDMMKNMFSDEKNPVDSKEMMQKMCECMSGNPLKS